MAGKPVTVATVNTALEKVAVRQAVIDARHTAAAAAARPNPAGAGPTTPGGGNE